MERKTLILAGSPRKSGNTARMAKVLASRLLGQVETISLDNRTDITPCRDCRYCLKHSCCAIHDGMDEIYQKLDAADQIVFAAPVYFYNIPGSMKAVLDRLQVYWAAKIRGNQKPMTKKGGILLAGGAPEFPGQFLGAIQTLSCMLEDLGAVLKGTVTMGGTDKKGLEDRPDVCQEIATLAENFNRREKGL